MPYAPTRNEDECLLRWLDKRASGETSRNIGSQHGKTPEAIRVATNRVLNADMDECNISVAGWYW